MIPKKERIKEAQRNSAPVRKPKPDWFSVDGNPAQIGLHRKTKRGKKR